MTGEGEAAGDVLTGGIVARAVEGSAGSHKVADGEHAHGPCRNCGAELTGAYCVACGQPAHIHRSLLSLGHDILHGVFHLEGKIWRTLPELFFHPGRLTRRYIDGERVKFVSPMALFLFTVFLMFAVFSFTSGGLVDNATEVGANATDSWKRGNSEAIEATEQKLETVREQLEAPDLAPAARADLERQASDLESARAVMQALAAGDWDKIEQVKASENKAAQGDASPKTDVDTGWPALNARLKQGLKDAQENPRLLLYKVKINSYKFSWLLIPLSVPFLWVLFFWRRDIHVYDHAVFATYSLSFMMLLTIVLAVAASLGVPGWIWGTALVWAPPVHLYKQLRRAYGLSRFGAVARLVFLTIAGTIVLTLFFALLLLLGVFG